MPTGEASVVTRVSAPCLMNAMTGACVSCLLTAWKAFSSAVPHFHLA